MEGQITLANHNDKDWGRADVRTTKSWSRTAVSKKHAVEYARLITEYEEMTRPPGKETNKDEVAKVQELNSKFEEIPSLMNDMAGKSNLSRS